MAKPNRIAGVLYLRVDGETQSCAGDFTWNLGIPTREPLINSDGSVPGYSETPVAPYIAGTLRLRSDMDIKSFYEKDGIDAQLELANGDVYQFIDGWCSGTGEGNTAEGTLDFRFEAKSAEKV